MKKLLLIIFCCFAASVALAQTVTPNLTVKGTAIDSATKQPLAYVTVALLDAKTQQSVKGTLTKDDGSFELKTITGKAYQAVFVFVGYANKVINITGTSADVDLGKVLIAPASKRLKEVAVTAIRPVMKREVDRISYDVQADPESKALTALDMMRKVPLLSVDASDAIKLKGSGNYKILINGKESALVANNPSDVLRSMPATDIEKIEVITTPPAKYDAEGLAGIINIITKKNAAQGYNANLNGRYNSLWGPAINLSGNIKQGKLGLSFFSGYNYRNGFTGGNGNTQTFTSGKSVSQLGTNYGANKGNNHYISTELSYEIDSLDLLTASFGTFVGHNQQNNDLFSSNLNSNGSVAQQYLQNTMGYNNYQGLNTSLNYQIGFKNKKDRLLTLSYRYNYSPNTQYSNSLFSDRVKAYQSVLPNFNQYNNSGGKEPTFQVDYTEPYKIITIEAGGKAILRNNYSNFNRSDLDSASNQYKQNPLYTDDFNYQQDVYSLYNSYQIKLNKWTGKVGLRLEHTSIQADFTSVNTTVNQGYNNLIPSVSIQRTIGSNDFNFGFTQRIQRPGIYQLNPFVNNSNPLFISTGNPNLRPELNNTFEFNYSNFSKNSLNMGLSYQFSNNSIQNVTNLITKSAGNNKLDTITSTTYQNLGSNRSLGFNINTQIAITKKISLSLNGQISKVWLKGTYNGQFYQNSGVIGEAFGNLGYKFAEGYRFGIDAGFFSGDINLQGKSSNFIYNSYVFTKEFLKKKASISLVANDPESKYHNNTSNTTTPQFYQSSYNLEPYRNYAIRFSYRFGKLNSEIKKNQRGIENDDTKGGGKTSSGGN